MVDIHILRASGGMLTYRNLDVERYPHRLLGILECLADDTRVFIRIAESS